MKMIRGRIKRFMELLYNQYQIQQMSRSPNARPINIYNNISHPIQSNPKFIDNQMPYGSIQRSFTEEQIDSQAQPAFETQNYVYELKSRCNTLEYEKTKHEMAYQNIVSQLRQKNAYLQQLASNLSQKNQQLAEERDQVRLILSEVREKNHQLAKQIERFKLQIRELQSVRKISQQYQSDQNLLYELQQKNQQIGQQESRIIQLQNQINRYESTQTRTQYPKDSAYYMREQIATLSNQLQAVKKELDQAQRNQQQLKRLEQHRQQSVKSLKLKQVQIASLQQDKIRLQQEVERVKDSFALKEKRQQSSYQQELRRLNQTIKAKQEQLQESQNSKSSIEMKVTEFTVQLSRLKSQNNGLEQYNKYLQSCNTQNQSKRKIFQQQIYKYQKEVSELRTMLFNQKLQNKKCLSNIRLSFEQQKIKHIQQIDQKSKQVLKLKQLSASSQRQNIDYDKANHRYENLTSQIEKASQQISHLKTQNQKLKQDLRHLQAKYQKKNQKYSTLQKELKLQYGNRIKSLQNQIYKLQLQNSQMQVKIQTQCKPYNRKNQLDDLVNFLKLQNKQKEERIKELQNKCKKQQDKISKQQVQNRQPRHYYNKEETNGRLKAIDQLQLENNRLNDEVRKQRSLNDQIKRENNTKQQKIYLQLRKKQEENELINKKLKQSQQQLTILEEKIIQLQDYIKQKQKQKRRTQDQFSVYKTNSENTLNLINETHRRQFEDLKRTQQRQLGELKYKQQVKQELQSKKVIQSNQEGSMELEFMKKCNDLQKQNYQLKVDYSQSLQEINSLLLNYKKLQEKHKKLIAKNEEAKIQINSIKTSKVSSDYLLKQMQEYKQLNINHQAQIQRLNQALMEKQKEVKQLNSISSPLFHPKVDSKVRQTQLWLSPKHMHLRNGNKSYKN